jgi:class 3 adenylate cyclase
MEKYFDLMESWLSSIKPEKRVLFYSDIENSTEYAKKASEHKEGKSNVDYIAYHHLIVENAVLEFNGEMGNKWGDAIVCLFNKGSDAILAGDRIIEDLNKYSSWLREKIIKGADVILRIGIHIGKYFPLPMGWEKEILKMRTPKLKEKNWFNKEIVGYDICVVQRIESIAEPGTMFISGDVLRDFIDFSKKGDKNKFVQNIRGNQFLITKNDEKLWSLKEKLNIHTKEEEEKFLPKNIYNIENIYKAAYRKIKKYVERGPDISISQFQKWLKKEIKINMKITEIKNIISEIKKREE